jgi:hypothetical protein
LQVAQPQQSPCEQFLARQFTDDPNALFVDINDGNGFDPVIGADKSYIPFGTKPPFSGSLGETHNHIYNDPKDVKKPINILAPSGGVILDSGYTSKRDSFITVYYKNYGTEKDVVLQFLHVDNFNRRLLDRPTDDAVLGQMGPEGGGAFRYDKVPGRPMGYHVHVNAMKKWWKGNYVRDGKKATQRFLPPEARQHIKLSALCN